MAERKHIALLCTLDTKGEHAAFIKAHIERHGHAVVLADIGVLGEPGLAADMTRREIAAAGGADLDALAAAKDRGAALAAMSAGAAAAMMKLYGEGRLDGILGLGGGSGTAIATTAMRALPVGVPKVMISTMASTVKAASYV
ncbi:MAG: Tm-1-like ATP-binding domain-containing protein, partial [Hyphomicrobiaceae bacterium]